MAKSKATVMYKGKLCNVSQLATEHGMSPICVVNRLRNGWSIEDALSNRSGYHAISEYFPEFKDGNTVYCVFTQPLASVYKKMQPELNREYELYARCIGTTCKVPTFFIYLDENKEKPLIVYQKEFTISRIKTSSETAAEL